jgi:hypothetical protein
MASDTGLYTVNEHVHNFDDTATGAAIVVSQQFYFWALLSLTSLPDNKTVYARSFLKCADRPTDEPTIAWSRSSAHDVAALCVLC